MANRDIAGETDGQPCGFRKRVRLGLTTSPLSTRRGMPLSAKGTHSCGPQGGEDSLSDHLYGGSVCGRQHRLKQTGRAFTLPLPPPSVADFLIDLEDPHFLEDLESDAAQSSGPLACSWSKEIGLHRDLLPSGLLQLGEREEETSSRSMGSGGRSGW